MSYKRTDYYNSIIHDRFAVWIRECYSDKTMTAHPTWIEVYNVIYGIEQLIDGYYLSEFKWTGLVIFNSGVEKLYDVEWWKLNEHQWTLIETFRPDLREFITNNKDQYLLMREMDELC